MGKPVDAEDANGTSYSGFYNDPLDRPTQIVRAAKDDRQPRLLRNHIMAKPAHHVRRQLSAHAADLHDRPFPETVLEKAAVWGVLGERIFARGRTKPGC